MLRKPHRKKPGGTVGVRLRRDDIKIHVTNIRYDCVKMIQVGRYVAQWWILWLWSFGVWTLSGKIKCDKLDRTAFDSII